MTPAACGSSRCFGLHGDFSFDAISPSGNRIYLINYLSPTDATKYAVRAYDVQAGRLLPEPVVDPHEADEQMRGQPISRAMSPDGRWAYTLYDGNGKTPFVHALDTSRATARCIDLDALEGEKYLWGLRLSVDAGGKRLVVRNGLAPELVVNTETFAVSKPPQPSQPQHGKGRARLALGSRGERDRASPRCCRPGWPPAAAPPSADARSAGALPPERSSPALRAMSPERQEAPRRKPLATHKGKFGGSLDR